MIYETVFARIAPTPRQWAWSNTRNTLIESALTLYRGMGGSARTFVIINYLDYEYY